MRVNLYSKEEGFLGQVEVIGSKSEAAAAVKVIEAVLESEFMQVEYDGKMEYVRSSDISRFEFES